MRTIRTSIANKVTYIDHGSEKASCMPKVKTLTLVLYSRIEGLPATTLLRQLATGNAHTLTRMHSA
jgi:hypothetical protein